MRDREHQGDTQQHFNSLDVSNDGFLDNAELLGVLGHRMERPEHQPVREMLTRSLRRALDGNDDGRVHRSEFVMLMHHDL